MVGESAEDRFTDGEKRAILAKIAPGQVLRSLRQIRAEINTYDKLKHELTKHAEDEKADAIIHMSNVPMDLSALQGAPDIFKNEPLYMGTPLLKNELLFET